MIKKAFKILTGIFFFTLLAILLCAGVFFSVEIYPLYETYQAEAKEAIAESDFETFKQDLTSFIYDDEDVLLAELSHNGNKTYLYYEEIPENVLNAFIAIEDRNFWEHPGIDLKAIARVGIQYVKSGGKEKHGGSTITQQLVRNVFITKEVTLDRKIKEICYALEMEKKYNKEEIIEFYINNIFFWNNCYGIEAAANFYFSKSADELTLSEAAYLCAIPNSPSYYDPLKDARTAIPRRNKILKDMYELGMIDNAAYHHAIVEEICLQIDESPTLYDYQTTYAIDCTIRYFMKMEEFPFQYSFASMDEYKAYQEHYEDVYEEMRRKLYTGGYTVKTTLNSARQELLQTNVDEVLAFDEELQDDGQYALQGAATLINNHTGKVEAIVGGRTSQNSTYTLNRAFQSYRQPGSSIKPLIVYLPALEQGYTDTSMVADINVEKAKENPENTGKLTGKSFTIRSAVEQSKNGVAWKLFYEMTPAVGLGYLQNMRFARVVPDDFYPAASLGGFTYGVSTTEMASAYSCMVNYGKFRPADCITSVTNKNGLEIYEPWEEYQVYQEDKAYAMIDILKGVITKGTARGMRWAGKVEAAGKTGTTNNSMDGWFVGIIPDYAMAVWVGYDIPREVSNMHGGTYPVAIWKGVMETLAENPEQETFQSQEEAENAGEKYMPGRDGSELLSKGYTVQNYRDDHALADEAEAILEKIREGVYTGEEAKAQYRQAQELVEKIYGQKLRNLQRGKLDEVYRQYLQ